MVYRFIKVCIDAILLQGQNLDFKKKHHQNKMGKDLLSDKSGMLLIFHVFIDY